MDLQRRGWLACHESWRGVVAEAVAAPTLNEAQAAALSALPLTGHSVTLLDGVTGSGKTEVYLRWIERLSTDGGQVLLLVPEIGLVQALAARLAARLAGLRRNRATGGSLGTGLGAFERGELAASRGEAGWSWSCRKRHRRRADAVVSFGSVS